MKLVRILVYEGDEDAIKKHVSQMFVGPDRPHLRQTRDHQHPLLSITEIFRGWQPTGKVEHLEMNALADEVVAEIKEATEKLQAKTDEQ